MLLRLLSLSRSGASGLAVVGVVVAWHLVGNRAPSLVHGLEDVLAI